eukprot:87199_1
MDLPIGYPNNVTNYIHGISIYSLSIVTQISLLFGLLQSYNQIQKSSKLIKISVILSVLFSFFRSFSWLNTQISLYLMTNATVNNPSFMLMFQISYICGYSFQCCYCIVIGYYLKIKLEDTYKDKFFAINRRIINISFIVYSLSIIFHQSIAVDHLIVAVDCYHCDKIEDIATIQWTIVSITYCSIFITLFYKKLHKFLSLTINNNKTLSFDLNDRLQN